MTKRWPGPFEPLWLRMWLDWTTASSSGNLRIGDEPRPVRTRDSADPVSCNDGVTAVRRPQMCAARRRLRAGLAQSLLKHDLAPVSCVVRRFESKPSAGGGIESAQATSFTWTDPVLHEN